jgi:hypothetical protein
MSSITWFTLEEFGKDFRETYLPPKVNDLVGRSVKLYYSDGGVESFSFKDDGVVAWSRLLKSEAGEPSTGRYVAFRARDSVYFVDITSDAAPRRSLTLVLDLGKNIFTSILGEIPLPSSKTLLDRVRLGEELTDVRVVFGHGSIDRPPSAEIPRHEKTNELLGKRVEFRYGPRAVYEHIYFESLFTWHCLMGVEKGLADTDRADYFKLSDNLYLLVWREKIIPTMGVEIVDLGEMRAFGKLFGYSSLDGMLGNIYVGAKLRVVCQAR